MMSPLTPSPRRGLIATICNSQVGSPTIFLNEAAVGKIKLIFVVGFLVAFAAGLMVGMVGGRATAAPSAAIHVGHSWLGEELDLTSQQQDQIHKIWADVTRDGPGGGQRWGQMDKQRDQEVRALLTPEQLPGYDQILRAHHERVDAIRAETRKAPYEEAERRTREILTDSQRLKFDEITRKRHEHDRDRDSHAHGLAASPATRPATAE